MALLFLDLFAGAGGLSEGFIQAGYVPVAHVEMDKAACFTLKTRASYHYLKHTEQGRQWYKSYLEKEISRVQFYSRVPQGILDSVINATIGEDTMASILAKLKTLCNGRAVDVIVGGPPCQAYSVAGRAILKARSKEDPRKQLYKYYAQFLEVIQPKVFVFENVLGLFTAKDFYGNLILPQIRERLDKSGYVLHEYVYSADDHGIPQRRKRIIIVGIRKDLNFLLNDLPCQECPVTIGELFSDLAPIHAGEGSVHGDGRRRGAKPNSTLVNLGISDTEYPVTYHKARFNNAHDLEIYRRVVELWNLHHERFNYAKDLPLEMRTHKNVKGFLDRFKVVDAKAHSSHTVLAHMCKDGHYYIHPDINQNRSLSPREAARLQTFPDNYFFEAPTEKECLSSAYRQIGNAVPVRLARLVAEQIKHNL